MPDLPGHHVFFDPTGRRWRRFKLALLVVVGLLTVAGLVSWERVQEPPTLDAARQIPSAISISGVPDRPPVIGTGPLARVVRVDRGPVGALTAVDPLSNQVLHPIVGVDAESVGTSRFAVDRYGYSSAAHRTISLTFDDGPDPTWTPKILDLLHEHGVQATFFVVGSEAARHPHLMARIVSDGHAVGNHTFTHPPLTARAVRQELVPTDRIIRATTGVRTRLFRMPFDAAGQEGPTGEGALRAMLAVERLGYRISIDDFDTGDWKYGEPDDRPATPIPLPPTSMDNMTVLLHDGGGNRAETLAYLERLIPWARANGYTFHSLPQVSEEVKEGTVTGAPGLWDRALFYWYQAIWNWPDNVLNMLFLLAVVSVALGGLLNVALALVRRLRYRRRFAGLGNDFRGPPVSVVIAAFNEEAVIAKTLDSVTRSRYLEVVELIVVDDGSTDGTAGIVAGRAARDPRIRLLRQRNSGKAGALNRGFRHARGEIVVTLDADTIFTPDTIGNLVRHFLLDDSGDLAVVSGIVKVGNLRRLLSRWQALEYVTQIGVERGAQDLLRGIMVVPGACAAWRRDAVLLAGGYSDATLTEDCDMALMLQRLGYRVVQDDEAVCFTEVPEKARALTRQRFRWMYGNIQALWKHRDMILNPRFGWLGMLTLPSAVMSVIVPVVFLPFVYAMAVVAVRGQGPSMILVYGALFLGVQLAAAVAGVWLTRERPVHLWMVPLYRIIYEPLRAYLLYKATFAVLSGTSHGWSKVPRLGSVPLPVAEEPMEVAS